MGVCVPSGMERIGFCGIRMSPSVTASGTLSTLCPSLDSFRVSYLTETQSLNSEEHRILDESLYDLEKSSLVVRRHFFFDAFEKVGGILSVDEWFAFCASILAAISVENWELLFFAVVEVTKSLLLYFLL